MCTNAQAFHSNRMRINTKNMYTQQYWPLPICKRFLVDMTLAKKKINKTIFQQRKQAAGCGPQWNDGEMEGGVEHQSNVEVADSSRAHENNGAESTSLRPFIPL